MQRWRDSTMETRASYVIVGTFTLLAIFAGLGFFLWLAKVQIDKTYTQYDILFDQVPGLAQSSPVRFNGVDVGKVVAIALERNAASQVRVRIEVGAATPVRQGTQATLSSQGVTGVAFVGLEGGSPDAPRLPIDPATDVAEIPSKPTVVQGLIEDAPDLLKQAIKVMNDIGKFTTPENAEHVTSILANLDAASGQIETVMADLGRASDSLSAAADQISGFSGKLDGVAENANGAITDFRTSLDGLSASTDQAIGDARAALTDARKALASIDAFAANGLPQITALSGPISRLVTDLSGLTAQIRRDPARFFLGNRTPEYTR